MRSIRFALAVLAFLLLAATPPSASAQSGRRPTYNPPTRTERQQPGQATPRTSAPTEKTQPAEEAEKPAAKHADRSGVELKPSPAAVSHTPDDDTTIKVDTALVTVPVTAVDSAGRYIPNLKKSDFKIYEDGVEQEIESFGAVEVPFNVVLLMDTSGSTEFKLSEIQQAAIAFVEQLRPEDRVMVVSFDEKVYVDCEFTSDRARLRRAILSTVSGGSTKLYDAVDLVITERLSQVKGRRAIVLFTDGKDTSSRLATARSTLARVEESDILVYPIYYDTADDIRINGPGFPRGPGASRWPLPMPSPYPSPRRNPYPGRGRRWPFDSLITYQFPQNGGRGSQGGGQSGSGNYGGRLRGGSYLRALAEKSGGRFFFADSITNLSQAFASVAEELRHQYTLSYYPTNTARDGSYRQVKVRAAQPGIIVRAKDGYRAGGATDAKSSPPAEEKRPTLKRNIAAR